MPPTADNNDVEFKPVWFFTSYNSFKDFFNPATSIGLPYCATPSTILFKPALYLGINTHSINVPFTLIFSNLKGILVSKSFNSKACLFSATSKSALMPNISASDIIVLFELNLFIGIRSRDLTK